MKKSIYRQKQFIFSFSGRLQRELFWIYCLKLFLTIFLLFTIGCFAFVFPVFFWFDDFITFYKIYLLLMILVSLAFIILISGPVSRRLHDIGKSGLWGIGPAFLAVFGIVYSYINIDELFISSSQNLSSPMAIISTLYFVSLIGLIILLSKKGDAGPNEFG